GAGAAAGRPRQHPERAGGTPGDARARPRGAGTDAGAGPRGTRAALPGAAVSGRDRGDPGRERGGGEDPAHAGIAAAATAAGRGGGGGRTTAPASAKVELTTLLEEYAARLQAGEPLEAEAFAAAHPEHAEVLRKLLPTMRVLAEMGSSPGASG